MTSVWNRFFGRKSKILETLPEELLVDEILSQLTIRDILRLRRVNKAFNLLTKKPSVWKRFLPLLKNIQQPLAPLPPTSQYDFRHLSALDIEHLVTRAVSLDDNWRSNYVVPQYEYDCLAYHDVLEMVMLPGGHFMVSSVRSFDKMYGIVLWALDHPATGKPSPLAFRYTEVKAYALRAKYMTVQGKKGICIAFLRKRHKVKGDTRHIPETAELGGKEDAEDLYMPLKYECTTIHISMQAIESLTDRRCVPQTPEFDERARAARIDSDGLGSIRAVSRIRTGTQLGAVGLDIIGGASHVCVVKRPGIIVFERLDDNVRSTLECKPVGQFERQPASIWNFRVLPAQRQVLVFRAVERLPLCKIDHYLIEIYPLPSIGAMDKLQRAAGLTIQCYSSFQSAQISELTNVLPGHEDVSVMPFLLRNKAPPPISLYLRMRSGMIHYSIFPTTMQLPPTPTSPTSINEGRPKPTHNHYFYDLSQVYHISCARGKFDANVESLRVLPGAYRALVYEVPHDYLSTDPPIKSLWSYVYIGKDHTRYVPNGGVNAPGVGFVASFESGDISTGAVESEEQEIELALAAGVPHHLVKEKPAPDEIERLDFPRKKITKKRKSLVPISILKELAAEIRKGVAAICWDEDTGRVVIATKKDKQLHIMDFAFARTRGRSDKLLTETLDKAIEADNERIVVD